MSAEIAMAGVAERKPRFMKIGGSVMDDGGFRPGHTTELAGALATVHLLDGNRKKSRRMFATSMIDPTGNALAQGEWAAFMRLGDVVPLEHLRAVYDAHEAEALHTYREGRFEKVAPICLRWAEADPFSIRPYELGAISANNAGMYETAIEMARRGIAYRSHPTNLQQSLVFALASSNKLNEAEAEIALMHDGGDEGVKSRITANRGLIAFRRGNPDAGRTAYRSAMEGLRRAGNHYGVATASYFFARECMLAETPDALERVAEATKLMEPFKQTEAWVLLERLKDPALEARRAMTKSEPTQRDAKTERLRSIVWSIQGQPGPPRRLIQ